MSSLPQVGHGVYPGGGNSSSALPTAHRRDVLLWAAAEYHGRGWRPFPVKLEVDDDGKKLPTFPRQFSWAALRDAPLTWEETVSLFESFEEADGVAITLEPGHVVIDTDSAAAAEVVEGIKLPEGPRARTRRGCHYHFRAPAGFATGSHKPGDGLEFLAAQVVFCPPTPGYHWEALPSGELPELPTVLAALLRMAANAGRLDAPQRAASPRADKAAEGAPAGITADELAPWREALGELKRDGPSRWRALCPLHVEQQASFSVFRVKRTGRLVGHCFGCHWSGSLRQLRRALRHGDTTLYRQAAEAVLSLGEQIDDETRRVLLLMVSEMQKRGLHPGEPFGWSYREIARQTGCEPLDDSRDKRGRPTTILRWHGKAVKRLLAKMAAIPGLEVHIGRPRLQGKKGRRTEFRLPAAWFARPASQSDSKTDMHPSEPFADPLRRAPVPSGPTSKKTQEQTNRAHLPSSDVGPSLGKQAKGQTGGGGAAVGLTHGGGDMPRTTTERDVFPKNISERIEVWSEPYRGRDLVHARVHYLDEESGEWRPTKKGLSLSPELAEQVAQAYLGQARVALGDEAATDGASDPQTAHDGPAV